MKTYKNAINKIKASESFKAQTAEMLVCQQANKKKFRFAPVAAIAASLAVVIALGAVFFPMSKENKSFVITANAAELNDNSFTTIGELPANNWRADVEKNEIYVIADFTLEVKGENIKNITYTIDNGAFAVPDNNDKLILTKQADKNVCVPKRENKSFYSEITAKYNNQIDTTNDNVEIVFNPAKIDKDIILIAERYGKFADVWVYDTEAEKLNNYQKTTEEFFSGAVKDCRIKVQAEYSDGTIETQRLTYNADVKLYTEPLTFHTKNGDETRNVYIAKVNLKAKLA
ncbi:MAG: hypothetical protein IJT79_08085 [Ruminococcus sp.]|nr:hypothetical protein [Ruminococcus sp.]